MSSSSPLRGRRAARSSNRVGTFVDAGALASAGTLTDPGPPTDAGPLGAGPLGAGPPLGLGAYTGAGRRVHAQRRLDGAVRGIAPATVQTATQWLPEQRVGVLLVTESSYLQDEAARISAAAAVELSVTPTIESTGSEWDGAAAVLVGSDISGAIPRRRGPTVLIGDSAESETLWRLASMSGVDRVAVLPAASEWLAEFLGRLRDPASAGFILGIVGGCGGAGASTLAVLLAGHTASQGIRTLLVDGDEWGGGLDLAIAGEELAGLRWPDLQAAAGSLNPAQLAAALPVVAGFSLLTWGQHPHEAAGHSRTRGLDMEVLKAARRGYELTVVDVGRSRDALSGLGQFCDQLLVVVPARMRSAVASAQLLAELPPLPTSLVIRGPMREGLDSDLIAGSVGVPAAAVMPPLRGVAAAAERGQLLDLLRSRSVRRLAGTVLAGLGGIDR